jgi:biotin operon repressor
VARKKKIPSIDETVSLIVERIYSDLGAENRRLREQLTTLSRKVAGFERKLNRLRAEAELRQLRPETGPATPRKRVSPEKAQKAILVRLKRARGNFVTSKELGGPLGIGRATVAIRVKELRDLGHDIVSSPRKGYALL